MLSTAQLASMRSAINQLLPDTCSILSLTRTSDGAGGWSEIWGTVTGGSNVPCRVDYISGREAVTGGALLPYQKAVITLAYDVAITEQNRIQVGANVFSVQAGNSDQSWKADSRISVERVP